MCLTKYRNLPFKWKNASFKFCRAESQNPEAFYSTVIGVVVAHCSLSTLWIIVRSCCLTFMQSMGTTLSQEPILIVDRGFKYPCIHWLLPVVTSVEIIDVPNRFRSKNEPKINVNSTYWLSSKCYCQLLHGLKDAKCTKCFSVMIWVFDADR